MESNGGFSLFFMPADPLAKSITFAGEFLHSLDDKHRITIPSAWRKGEGDEFFVVPDESNEFLSAMPPHEFSGVRDVINSNKELSPQERQHSIRRFYTKARQCVMDRQGRLVLPEDHCRQAGLEKEVMLAGVYNKFEIWNPKAYAKCEEAGLEISKKVSGMIVI